MDRKLEASAGLNAGRPSMRRGSRRPMSFICSGRTGEGSKEEGIGRPWSVSSDGEADGIGSCSTAALSFDFFCFSTFSLFRDSSCDVDDAAADTAFAAARGPAWVRRCCSMLSFRVNAFEHSGQMASFLPVCFFAWRAA